MTIKAVRAQIKLGDIDLDVFQLPDGSYRMSAKQVTGAIGIRHSRVAQISATKQVQNLTGQGLQVADFSPEKLVCSDSGNISGYTLEVASIVWQFEAAKGNELAQALSFACVVESLERRADAAFGVQVSEEERQAKLALRVKSKATRRKYTDVLKERLIEQIGEERYKAIAVDFFKNTTIQVNQHLYQQPHFNCDRDNMTEEQLSDIELFERQLERRAHRLPEHTAEELLAWMLGNY